MANGCEFEFMEYMDEQSIDPNLICSICHKPLKDPVCTSCDHTYGRACITRWLNQNDIGSCPMCLKKPLSINELTQASRPLRNMLDQLRVQCLLCTQTGLQRGNFVDHMNKVCPKSVIQCQAADIKCPWKGPRDELQNHMIACVFEPLRPVLSTLIAENRQLIDQVQKHDNEIKALAQKMYQLQKSKHIPQWNTRLQVNISYATRKNLSDCGKANNQGNIHGHQEAKVMEESKEVSNKDKKGSAMVDQLEPQIEDNKAETKKNTRSHRRNFPRVDKPTS
ncbi:unnamed protein product [Rotaria sp. Silwood1]|nr:unnamed protein product [Rotaria sp. Silwood1]CAF4726620.1 unnamed protein product [Rotaria sp. Silwood1]CAF4860356.1 unnamed protein product [Rotaria sp. Silwood1]